MFGLSEKAATRSASRGRTKGVTLVNVLTDPADAYPRSSNLA